ncbi:MAG: hypothetical protein AD742_17610 [Methylibium sp. NZG]|nr:MAG: hypothetical protein AD742_17610 [Methylibium sp. NZG]
MAVSVSCLAACAAPTPGAAPVVASASAAPSAAPAASAELRVLVKLAKPAGASADTAAIATQVAAAAGTNARYLAASSPQWHALALRCADVQACEAAYLRLSADKAAFEVVQRDERKRIVTP